MAVLIIFPVILQTVINLLMLSIGGDGANKMITNNYSFYNKTNDVTQNERTVNTKLKTNR